MGRANDEVHYYVRLHSKEAKCELVVSVSLVAFLLNLRGTLRSTANIAGQHSFTVKYSFHIQKAVDIHLALFKTQLFRQELLYNTKHC